MGDKTRHVCVFCVNGKLNLNKPFGRFKMEFWSILILCLGSNSLGVSHKALDITSYYLTN